MYISFDISVPWDIWGCSWAGNRRCPEESPGVWRKPYLYQKKQITDKSYITKEEQPLQRKKGHVVLKAMKTKEEHGWQHPVSHTEEERGGFGRGVAQERRLQHISPALLCSGSISTSVKPQQGVKVSHSRGLTPPATP